MQQMMAMNSFINQKLQIKNAFTDASRPLLCANCKQKFLVLAHDAKWKINLWQWNSRVKHGSRCVCERIAARADICCIAVIFHHRYHSLQSGRATAAAAATARVHFC